MNRSPSMLSVPTLSSPLASDGGAVDAKRRKSHQWFMGSRRSKAGESHPGGSRMSIDTAALPIPSKNPARAMVERRHSYQNVHSRIPQPKASSPLTNVARSSLSHGYIVPNMPSQHEAASQIVAAPDRQASPDSSYSSSSYDESDNERDELTDLHFDDFSFDVTAPADLPTFAMNPFNIPNPPSEEVPVHGHLPSAEPLCARIETGQRKVDRTPSHPSGITARLSRHISKLFLRRYFHVPAPFTHGHGAVAAADSVDIRRVASIGSFSGMYEGTAFYVKPTGRDLPSPGPESEPSPPVKHGRYAHRVPKNMDEAIDFSRIRCPVPVPATKAPILGRDEAVVALSDAYMGKSYGVIGQADPDNEEGTDGSDRTAFSDFELASGEPHSDDGYAYPSIPAAYEFVDPEIPCTVPDAAALAMTPSEEQLLHHGMAHPWANPPYNIPERQRRSVRQGAWRPLQAFVGAVVVSALLLPLGAVFMVIDVGAFGVGIFGLLMIADFAFRVGAAALNRRKVNQVTKQSPISRCYETYTTMPRINRPKLPECSITVVGYRENGRLWEDCLESLKAQQYPVKHIVSVIDGNEPADMAMSFAFGNAFPENDSLIVHFPVLLSVLYVQKYKEALHVLGQVPTRLETFKAWLTSKPIGGHIIAHETAMNYVLDFLYTKATIEKWSSYKALCFTQPHAHKRHAMFTAFLVATYALGTKDAVLTTDSDTRLDPSAASHLMAMLFSDENIAGVTGNVDVDRRETIIPNVYALGNWFSSNVDSPCQSFFGSVSRLSSPMAVYRVSDLMDIVSPWIMQTHFGKEATTGEDMNLASQLLSRGLKTAHTHEAMAYTDAPNNYVRWIKQQTRWSRAMYREALLSTPRLNNYNPWLAVEATKQLYYPAVLIASVLYLLYTPAHWENLVIWITTIGAAILLKTIYAVIVGRNFRFLLYPLNQSMCFFGVLPTRVWALLTTYRTSWCTSARSTHEVARSESFLSRTLHMGHLLVWYIALSVGLSYYLATALSQPFLWLVAAVGVVLSFQLYAGVFSAKLNFFIFAPRYLHQRRAKIADVEAYQAPLTASKAASKNGTGSERCDSASEDERFEADLAALPMGEMRKAPSWFGKPKDTVFEAPVSRKPSMLSSGMEQTTSSLSQLPFRKASKFEL
ncbi:Glycosyltransferase Family 2 protein [Trametes cinnabarina]|uniref:Glycosyltransferase Family 2 protein n=1 Tax=Pycnoporus cinnabarinus TaxID=5643 RepID=A0A060S8Q3_PYCCI|nr:Glycosyltransferase Family 2 protein [Trametes cinnabarina]